MKLVIVGLGIGAVHFEQAVKSDVFSDILTVDSDPAKQATYTSLDQLLDADTDSQFDMAIISTPNFTHRPLIDRLAPRSKLVLVEKPGLKSSAEWGTVVEQYPRSRIVMAKNNMFRDTTGIWQEEFAKSSVINIVWANKNRVPFPGGWFTNKARAWGGVSYDLMPHLIHMAVVAGSGRISDPSYKTCFQKWSMNDVQDTEYGVVNRNNPIYNVDDHCKLSFEFENKKINCVAAWKSDRVKHDMAEIQFIQEEHNVIVQLGLCPNNAYGKQMQFLLNMTDEQYIMQTMLDRFILRCIEDIGSNEQATFYDDLDLEEHDDTQETHED